jgi:hypothetical protein
MDYNPSNSPNTGNMIVLGDNTEHPGRQGQLFDYNFTLSQNPGYSTRTALVGVQSSDPKWVYQTFPILQKGTPPELEIINPSSKSFSFGTLTNPQAITFTTNAGWKFTTDPNFAKVVSATDSTAGAIYTGSNNALNSVTRTLTFTPVQTAAAETQAAGSKASTIVKFETANHIGVAADVEEVTLSRTVLERWDGVSFSVTSNPNGSLTLNATAQTNAAWQTSANQSLGDKSMDATEYGPKKISYTIPGNDSFTAAIYTFSAWQTSNSYVTKRDTTIHQTQSTLDYTSYSGFPTPPNKIPATGVVLDTSKYVLKFTGTYSGEFGVHVIRSGVIGTELYGITKDRVMSIRGANQWEDSNITFEYQKGNPLMWVPISGVSFIQEGYSINGKIQSNTISAQGQTITIYLTGYYPDMAISANYGSGTVASNLKGGNTGSLNLTIPTNGSWGGSRTINILATDAKNSSVVRNLTSLNQSGYYITPENYTSSVVQSGGTDFQYTFRGDFPTNLTVESSNEAIASAYIGSQSGGTAITVNANVTTNPGLPRTANIYLKSQDGTIRATWQVNQEGGKIAGRDWLVIGPLTGCEAPNINGGYQIETSPMTTLTPEEVEQIFIANGKVLDSGTTFFGTGGFGSTYSTHDYDVMSGKNWIINTHSPECQTCYVLVYK